MAKDKCEWKELILDDSTHEWETELTTHGMRVKYRDHPSQPIIKKSGGTFAMRDNGIDYLYIGNSLDPEPKLYFEDGKNISYWKPISEIEITDEIALLRPMVVTSVLPKNVLSKLIAKENSAFSGDREISGDFYICSYRDGVFTTMGVKLATVSDLEST